MTEDELLNACAFIIGRLQGLAGTVRYEMPEELRAEIREVADAFARRVGLTPFASPR